VIEQVTAVFAAPQPPFGIERNGGNNQVYVGVEVQSTVVRVQHSHRPRAPAQGFVILAERVYRGPSVADKEFV
jgi:hypothetical protein